MANGNINVGELNIIQTGLAKNYVSGFGDILKEINKGVQEQNKKNKELKEKQSSAFSSLANNINTRLSSYEKGGKSAGLHKQIFDNTYNYVSELKDKFELYNTIGDDDTPENKKKRMEIMGELNNVNQSVIDLKASLLSIGKIYGTDLSPGEFHKGISSIDLAVGSEILNMDGDYSNVEQVWNKKTNSITFNVTLSDENWNNLSSDDKKKYTPGQVISIKAKDLMQKFPNTAKANEISGNLTTMSGTSMENAKKAGLGDKFPTNMYIDDIVKQFGGDKLNAMHIFQTAQHGSNYENWKTPQARTDDDGNIIDAGFSGRWEPGSWANALETNSDLNGAYALDAKTTKTVVDDLIESGKLNMNSVDTDPPKGEISPDEYQAVMNMHNRDLVIDALVNPRNELYDHSLSVREFAKWRASSDEAIWNEEQRKKQEKLNELKSLQGDKNKERETIPVNYGVGYITTKSAKLLLQDIKDKKPKIFFSNKQYKFIPSINKYVELTKNPETGQTIQTPISNQDILMTAEIWQQGYRTEEFEQDVTGALDTATDKESPIVRTIQKNIAEKNQKEKDEEQNLRNQGMIETTDV